MQKYEATHQDALKQISDQLAEEEAILKAVKAFHGSNAASLGNSVDGGNPNRTLAAPEWGGETPHNWRKSLSVAGITISEFESGNELLGLQSHRVHPLTKNESTNSLHLRVKACTSLPREPGVHMVLTSTGSVWLLNKQTTAIDLSAGELCGFNVGTYVEVPQEWVLPKIL